MRAVLWGTPVNHQILHDHLATLKDLDIVAARDPASLAAAMPGAEIVIMPVRHYDAGIAQILARHADSLRLLQLINAGYDTVAAHPPPRGTIVATAGDALAPAIGEHVMALFLALARQLDVALRQQVESRWDDSIRGRLRVLSGSTVVVVGYGAIGKQVALRCKAFGMHVIGVRRSGGSDPHVDEMVTPAALDSVLARADRIAISLPLTDATRKLFDARRFAACKPGATLVNVARGGIVDTAALVAALQSGQIGAAGLDVTEPEPLPPEHPLWQMPRVLISPHVSGAGSNPLLARHIAANVGRYLAGEPLQARLAEFD